MLNPGKSRKHQDLTVYLSSLVERSKISSAHAHAPRSAPAQAVLPINPTQA